MNDTVWVTGVKSIGEIGDKLGIREKFFGYDWEEATHYVPSKPPEVSESMKRSDAGYAIKREEFPEASYVFSEKHFKRVKDLFYAGGFLTAKERLANVLARFDLGEGGLLPYTIYHEDKVTPLDARFFLINFGAHKQSFLPHESNHVRPFLIMERHGMDVWDTDSGEEDDDIAVSSAALVGPDLWFEPKLRQKIFMSGALVAAINKAGVNTKFAFKRCKIIDNITDGEV